MSLWMTSCRHHSLADLLARNIPRYTPVHSYVSAELSICMCHCFQNEVQQVGRSPQGVAVAVTVDELLEEVVGLEYAGEDLMVCPPPGMCRH